MSILKIHTEIVEKLTGEEQLAEPHELIVKDCPIVVDFEVFREPLVDAAAALAEAGRIAER
jgi:hypothetical protein